MGRRPATFRQSDLQRALRAAKRASIGERAEICADGRITLIFRGGVNPADSPLDKWMASRARAS